MAALTTAVAPSPPPTLGRRGIYLLRTSKCLAPPVSSLKTGALSGRISAPARNFRVRAARTESVRVSPGFRAPQFELMEPLTAKSWSLDDFEAYPALLVMFICNHCPFVKHLKKDIVKLANFYMKKGLAVVAISSNSIRTHPQDGPDFMAQDAKAFNYPFPYLYDESQDVAHAFGAICTPEFFLFKKNGRRPFELVYHGQFDDSRPSNNVPVTGRDLSIAIDCVLSFQPVALIQKPRSHTPKPSFLDSDVGFWTKVLIFIPLSPKPWMQHKVAPVDKTVSTDLQLKEDDRLQKL